MVAQAFALLFAIQTSSMPVGLASSPDIWSPPKSIPVTAPSLPAPNVTAKEVGALALQVRREIAAQLRSGDISRAQARAYRRDLEALGGCKMETGQGNSNLTQIQSSLEALSSLVYAAGSIVTPK